MASWAIGLDLGGTNARAAAVSFGPKDGDARIVAVHKTKHDGSSPERIADALAECAREAIREAALDPKDCIGAGLGLAGQVEKATGRVLVAPNLRWRDVDFAPLLSARLGMRVQLANDLAVATLGEVRAGAAKGLGDAVLVFVGSGVGCGLFLGGSVHRGGRGVAGELGHVKVHPLGRKCGCGELGCLEAYAGGHSLGARAVEAITAGRASSLQIPDGLKPTTGTMERAAVEGDALSRELLEEASVLIGTAAANVVTLLNPAVLILGGGVLRTSATMRRRIEELVRELAGRAALTNLYIVDPALGDDAGVIGGAFLAREAPPA